MKKNGKKPTEKRTPSATRDRILYSVLPQMVMGMFARYFRLQIEGAENIPRNGRGIIAPNHSGFAGFDALMIGHAVHRVSDRVPRLMAHHLWFVSDFTSIPAQKLGIIEATTNNGLNLLNKDELLVLFPEGETGNFKPTIDRYKLREYKRGFVRMALATQSPIIPTIVIGAEEANITLAQLKFTRHLIGTVLPIPLNVVPLPTKWKIHFLEPLFLPYRPEAADDAELVHEICFDIQEKMQLAINRDLTRRGSIF